jgi:guanyl-specific ribonuclease Sa
MSPITAGHTVTSSATSAVSIEDIQEKMNHLSTTTTTSSSSSSSSSVHRNEQVEEEQSSSSTGQKNETHDILRTLSMNLPSRYPNDHVQDETLDWILNAPEHGVKKGLEENKSTLPNDTGKYVANFKFR